MVKVFKFRKYDIVSDDFIMSGRMATYASLKRINAVPIRGSEIEIDRADVDSEGMTEIGFSGLIAVL
jgi:hypothetical protein